MGRTAGVGVGESLMDIWFPEILGLFFVEMWCEGRTFGTGLTHQRNIGEYVEQNLYAVCIYDYIHVGCISGAEQSCTVFKSLNTEVVSNKFSIAEVSNEPHSVLTQTGFH